MRIVPRYKLVWLFLGNAPGRGARIRFSNVEELTGRRVCGLEFYTDNLVVALPDQTLAIAGASDALEVSFTFKCGNTDRIVDMPLNGGNPFTAGGRTLEFEPFVVNWEASYARVGRIVNPNQSIPVGVIYLD